MVRANPIFYIFMKPIANAVSLRLHLPGEIVPATHKKAARPPRPANVRAPGGGEGAYRAPRGDRDDYRKKEGDAPGEFRPKFAGVGRGAPRE